VLEQDEQYEEIIARVAALDIGKAELVCCARVPDPARPGRRLQEVSSYSTMTRSLLRMADRLAELGVTRVVMEATSEYWKPVYYLLEAHEFQTWLVNARDVKHLPGRPKTDKLDAVWLCKVAERQMLRPSFVPPPEIRRLRDLTRYRCDLARPARHHPAELAVSFARPRQIFGSDFRIRFSDQFVLVSPLLCPVWLAGLWRLARDPGLRTWRAFALTWLLLVAVFVVTGAKPYYLAGLFPVLLAAGAPPVLAWTRRTRVRRAMPGTALLAAAVVNALLMLPLVPVHQLVHTPVPAVNYDAGETVGWPQLAATVAAVRARLPDTRVAVLARNYGEAGAVDHYLPALRPAYSGHNAYWTWGPPPDDATAVIVIGYDRARLQQWFGQAELAARIDNGVGLPNEEQGRPVWVARDRLAPWAVIWPHLRRYG
jgi:Transposase